MANYRDPAYEQEVWTHADIEASCWRCDHDASFDGAYLEGNEDTLIFIWDCPECGYKNTDEYKTDDYL